MPKTLARSVIARAGMPSAAARATASSMRTIPSVMENSLWSRRWTKAGFGIGLRETDEAKILPPAPSPHDSNLTAIENSVHALRSNEGTVHREKFMTPIKGLVALVPALAPAVTAAESVYKYQRPDGSTVYSDVPFSGANLTGRFELVQVPAPAKAGPARPERGGAKDPGELARQRVQDLEAADAAIKEAEQSLKEALERQQAGVEPLPGERLGNVGGHTSRLGPQYFERQRALAAEVDAARARLDEAYRQRNQLRE